MAKVSIIMGVFNCEPYLREAVDSLFRQTFTDWNLVICDDGSTDNSYELSLQYKNKVPEKIILIRNEKNYGLNYTLNHCLQYANGDYIARMDGDDISLPDRLSKEVDFLERNRKYSIVSCPMIYFDEHGEWGRGTCFGEVKKTDFIKGTPFCHAPCLVRREAYEAVNGYSTDLRTLRVEDYDLWFRMYEKGFCGYNLNEPLYMMRDNENAYKRRKLRYARNEMYVRWNGYRMLGIPILKRVQAFRPVLVWFLPKKVYMCLHHRKKLAS